MSTRVSWIDEAHLQALLQRLDAPPPVVAETEPPPPEHTPDEDDGPLPFFEGEEPAQPVEEAFPELPARPEPRVEAEPAAADEPHEEPAPAPEAESAPPLDRIRERLKMIRQRAAAAGILSHSAPAEEAAAPLAESPEARLAAFARQALARLPADSRLIILDADGSILWNDDPKPGLVLSTLMALKAARQASADAIQQNGEVIHCPLPPDHTLSIFTQLTTAGPLKIAVKARQPVSAEVLAPFRPLL